MDDPEVTRRGRPRDTTIDERALAAARQLLLSDGLEATTIQRVAEVSGVHASAIYRRWPSRLELIQDAAFSEMPPGQVRPTGDLREDLRRFLRTYVAALESPLQRAALPAVLGSTPTGRRRSPEAWLRLSVRPQFRAILEAAPEGSVDPTVNPDDVFDLVLGAALVQVVVPEEARPRPPVERTADLLLRLVSRPGPGVSPAGSLRGRD